MKKNLKKVISAVLSLALAASSFVAMNVSAATFADVADTASYAEAVNALAALGAISGYEDGTFQPNNNITRAEVATMVVAALNMTADAQNSGSTTQFADVNEKAAWAAGYVNVGVAQGYISGMSATEFAPQDNVTYAQILSMLTRILGYGEFAEARGGWPNGYLTAAATAGILSGVSAGANDAVTRAQVAQLIWNAIQAPVLDITTFSTSNTGSEMQKMDGNGGRSFKTPLSDRFDAYVLNVTVENTSKTGTCEIGEIEMKLNNSNDWDPSVELLVKNINTDTDDLKRDAVKVGKTDAETYVFSSAKVIATYVDDEFELVYFAPTAKVAQKAIDGTLVKESDTTAGELKIKKSKTTNNTTTYKLADDAIVYVNGVEIGKFEDKMEEAVDFLENSTGETVLVEGEKSGYYSRILINYDVIARVNQVVSKSGSVQVMLTSIKVPGKISSVKPGASFKINDDDIEDGTRTVSVAKNGQAADLAALAKDDVVAIQFNVKGTLEASEFIDILATNDVVAGKFYSYDEEEALYTIGEAEYEASANETLSLENGTSYSFKLDPYGDIFDYEVEAETKNFAIVERYIDIDEATNSSSEYSYMQVMTLDGQSKTLYIETEAEKSVKDTMTAMGIETSIASTAKNVAIKDRIIEYSVKASTGRVREVEPVTDIYELNDDEFNSAATKLGKTLAANALVLDATDYMEAKADPQDKPSLSDYQASSLAGLTDGVEYGGILVYKNNSQEYMYVIITEAGATFGGDSNFAVAASKFSTASSAIVNDEDVYTLNIVDPATFEASKMNISKSAIVFVDGEETEIKSANGLIKQGSAFFYTTDSDGFVNKIAVVYDAASNYSDLYKTETAGIRFDKDGNIDEDATVASKFVYLPYLADKGEDNRAFNAKGWKIDANDVVFTENPDTEVQLILAPVTQASAKSLTVGLIEKDTKGYYVDTDNSYTYAVDSEAKIYSFDMSDDVTGTEALSIGAFSGITLKDTTDGKAYVTGADTENGDVDFSQLIQMAFLMVVDGTVTNAIVFNG